MRTFGSMMPFLGVQRGPVQISKTQQIADQSLRLFREFQSLADRANTLEAQILRAEQAGLTVPDQDYQLYEEALQKTSEAHQAYAAARQRLRDARSEDREMRRSGLLGCD